MDLRFLKKIRNMSSIIKNIRVTLLKGKDFTELYEEGGNMIVIRYNNEDEKLVELGYDSGILVLGCDDGENNTEYNCGNGRFTKNYLDQLSKIRVTKDDIQQFDKDTKYYI